jgi:hypothetical protein
MIIWQSEVSIGGKLFRQYRVEYKDESFYIQGRRDELCEWSNSYIGDAGDAIIWIQMAVDGEERLVCPQE